MAKAKHTYAVRLAVEGGNRVKADLTSVGASGERSIKKIDRASDRASRGLGTLGDRASSLRRNMRLLGGVVAGVAAAGGLALLVKRSIDAADSIAKTADAIGISTDALQELRFAADLSGVSVESLDKALKFATKAIGELRTRTSSELTTALKDFDAQLLRNIESAGSVEEAINLVFRRMGEMEDATQKAALAKSVFGPAGIDLVNIVRGEAGALEEMRQHARDLGIVLDEELLRNAEKTKDQLTVLGTVLSANLNKAILEHADAIGDLAEQFTEALPTLIGWASSFGQWIGLIEQTKTERLAEIREELAEIDEAMQNWFRRALEWSAIDAMLGNEQNGPLKRKRAALVAESRFRKSCGSGQSADEEHDGGGVEEGAGRGDGGLEVLCQSPVAVDPGEEALHDPAARLDGEADLIGAFAHDLDGDHGGRGDLLAGVAAVGKDLLDERKRAA